MITIGTRLPHFSLKDQNGTSVTPETLRGKNVLLSFHPLAWTGVCQRQMEALEMNVSVFEGLNTVALGISVDSTPCKKAWADAINVTTTQLLSDFWPHGGLARDLGIFREADGISERANILVDGDGIVKWVKVYPIGDVPDIEEVLQLLKSFSS